MGAETSQVKMEGRDRVKKKGPPWRRGESRAWTRVRGYVRRRLRGLSRRLTRRFLPKGIGSPREKVNQNAPLHGISPYR